MKIVENFSLTATTTYDKSGATIPCYRATIKGRSNNFIEGELGYNEVKALYDSVYGKNAADKSAIFDSMNGTDFYVDFDVCSMSFVNPDYAETDEEKPTEPKKKVEIPFKERAEKTLGDMIKFFKEFQFEPNFRFVNTLVRMLKVSEQNGRDYVQNYFELIDSPFKNEIIEKMKCAEFGNMLKTLSESELPNPINKRLKLYYGSQGTGKTTKAMEESEGKCMVCNSALLPADLMEDFIFIDGKATFKPSALYESMTSGTKIVLDEINLLPFDSLRFLQTILDGKETFLYKGKEVAIKDGFQIIGTMNLSVNGMVYGLPEPLVDRCAETKKFALTAKDLMTALK